tara:strand:+ start:234 stop:626 length:393 start_codon:yes stop_codon:yes gene_type:complete
MFNNIEYKEKNCRNFGFTFCIIFGLIYIYQFLHDKNYLVFLIIALFFFVFSLIYPKIFRVINHYWIILGFKLGKIFSPLILSLIYIITILPVKLILKIFRKDILDKDIDYKRKSYWVVNNNKKYNFKDQF